MKCGQSVKRKNYHHIQISCHKHIENYIGKAKNYTEV